MLALSFIAVLQGVLLTPAPGFPKTAVIENRQFALTQSSCVVLASGRLVEGISVPEDGNESEYLSENAPSDLLAALPPYYRDAKAYRFNPARLPPAKPGEGQPEQNAVWLFWRAGARQCAVVARLHDPEGGAVQTRKVVETYGFSADSDGKFVLKLPANPGVRAPSSNLSLVAKQGDSDHPTFILVENR